LESQKGESGNGNEEIRGKGACASVNAQSRAGNKRGG